MSPKNGTKRKTLDPTSKPKTKATNQIIEKNYGSWSWGYNLLV